MAAALGAMSVLGLFGQASASVPANGIYEDNNGVAFGTLPAAGGCRYLAKATTYVEGSIELTRQLVFTGQYLNEPAGGCLLQVSIRLYKPGEGVRDLVATRQPNQSGDVILGADLGAVQDDGWRFVNYYVTLSPQGGGDISQLTVAYDVRACGTYPAVCNSFLDYAAWDGVKNELF